MKTRTLLCALTLSAVLITSCGNDDSNDDLETMADDVMTSDDEGTDSIAEDREATTAILTSSNGGIWRIAQATLTNSFGSYDISENFNVVDDEFVFSGTATDGSLEWRPGNDIAIDGSSSQETLLDFYKVPRVSTFSFDDDSSSTLTALNGDLVFEVSDEGIITGTLSFSQGRTSLTGETLDITLVMKMPTDYALPPSDGLSFTRVFTYHSNNTASYAPGMIGSYSDSSFFIVNREGENPNGGESERVTKFDVESGSTTDYYFNQADFVSKQLLIRDNKLLAIGGQYINTYDLELNREPTSVLHGKVLTRFGSAVQGNDVYLIGGDLEQDPNTGEPLNAEKVFKYDLVTQSLIEFAVLPERRFGARGTIINNTLYIFGGTMTFAGPDATTTIYAVNLENGNVITLDSNLPVNLNYTYVERFQNLVFIGGRIDIRDSENLIIARDHYLGVLNVETGMLEDISNNLPGTATDFKTILGMTVFNNKVYIMYGDGFDDDDNTDTLVPTAILAADIN